MEQQNDFSVPQKSSFLTLFLKFWAAAFCVEQVSLLRNGSERNSDSLASIFFPRNGIPSCFLFRWRIRKGILRVCFYFCFDGTEFRVVFSSTEVFGRKFRDFSSVFVHRNGIPSCFLFRGRVRNGIPRFSVPRNSRNSVGNNHLFRLFCLPRNYFFVGNSQPYVGTSCWASSSYWLASSLVVGPSSWASSSYWSTLHSLTTCLTTAGWCGTC